MEAREASLTSVGCWEWWTSTVTSRLTFSREDLAHFSLGRLLTSLQSVSLALRFEKYCFRFWFSLFLQRLVGESQLWLLSRTFLSSLVWAWLKASSPRIVLDFCLKNRRLIATSRGSLDMTRLLVLREDWLTPEVESAVDMLQPEHKSHLESIWKSKGKKCGLLMNQITERITGPVPGGGISMQEH